MPLTCTFGEALCCAVISGNVIIIFLASLFLSEGGGGDNVFDENLWKDQETGIRINVDDKLRVPIPPKRLSKAD